MRSLPHVSRGILPLAAIILVSGCCVELCDAYRGHGVRVDGVRLKHKRTVELTAELTERFEVEAHAGDIEIHGIPGDQARLKIELHEYREGDGEVRLTDRGELVAESKSGQPAAVGELIAELPYDLALEIETGLGDIEIREFAGSPGMELATGMGDIHLVELKDVLIVEASSGMGDITLERSEGPERVTLSTGMGSIRVRDSEAARIGVSSGMGGIDFRDCKFEHVSGSTGMGSIHFRDTAYEVSDVSTGMGSIRYH